MVEPHKTTLYMLGHGRLETGTFLARLRAAGVHLLVDVRSQPYSRWAPQYNREALQRTLRAEGLVYEFMGDTLGGRPTDPACYPGGVPEGRPDYARVRQMPFFRLGLTALLERVRRPQADGAVAVMCSEGDYHVCHRHLLIAPALREADPDLRIVHLTYEGDEEEYREEPRQMSLF